jgi:hypothetical protein
MLTQFIRVFKGVSDNVAAPNEGITLTDVSMENAEKTVHLFAQKYLYIAQKFPFNNIFIMLGAVANAQTTSKIKIEYWNGADEWVEAKDVMDFTKGLQRSGLVQFQLDNNDSWDCIPETDEDDEDSSIPDELVDLSINDCHWLRISFTGAVVDPLTQIKHLTYAFTTTEKVNAVDVQATRYYETFQTGKTNWQDEILVGSEMMIADMKAAGLLKSAGQIILLDDFILPCAWRVLEHIYSQMGTSYDGRRGEVKALYKAFLAGPKTIDQNADARISKDEEVTSSPRMYR